MFATAHPARSCWPVAALLELAEQAMRREFVVTGGHVLVLAASTLVGGLCVIFHHDVMSWSSRMLSKVSLPRRIRIVFLILAMLTAHVIELWMFGLTYWWLDTRAES